MGMDGCKFSSKDALREATLDASRAITLDQVDILKSRVRNFKRRAIHILILKFSFI